MAWRNDHPAVVRFWGDINRAAIQAVQHPGKVFDVNPQVSFKCDDAFLRMRLPGGRELAYPFPGLMTTDRGDLVVTYKDASSGKWADCRHHGQLGSWPGGWTENVVQAVARDLFAAAMPRLEAAGYPIVLHVHDGIVAAAPEDFGAAEDFKRIMRNRDGYPIGNGEDHASGSFGPSFIYRDENGQPFMRTTRRIDAKVVKHFPQQYWDGGKWIWGKPAGPKIPYRLPELLAAPPDALRSLCVKAKRMRIASRRLVSWRQPIAKAGRTGNGRPG
jgi:hypothetical protein